MILCFAPFFRNYESEKSFNDSWIEASEKRCERLDLDFELAEHDEGELEGEKNLYV